MEKFKDILKELIDEKGIKLTNFCRDCDINPKLIYDYFNGYSYPTAQTLIKLANYFKCSLDYMLNLTDIRNHNLYINLNGDFSLFIPRYFQLLKDNHTSHYLFAQEHRFGESVIRKWKKGSVPSLEKLRLIAYELGSSVDYLVGRI